MTTNFIDKLCDQYGLTKTEFLCIITNFQVENQTFAYAETIAKGRKLKFISQSAKQFFYRDDVKKFIAEQRTFFAGGYMDESDVNEQDQNNSKKDSKGLKDVLVPLFSDVELTTDNLKRFLEVELSQISDPKDRANIFIKAAEFLSLKDSGNNEFEKPIIYLPDRINITA